MRGRTPDESFDDLFDQDLHAALDATAAESRAAVTRRLMRDLSMVQNRGTPLRGAERYGSDGAVRLRFADGTSVLARGDGKGGLGFAAVAVLRGSSVLLTGLNDDGVRLRAALVWNRSHHVEIEVIGSDQPD